MNMSKCDVNANCTDTKDSYNCTCNKGYQGDGFNCTGKNYLVWFDLLSKSTFQLMNLFIHFSSTIFFYKSYKYHLPLFKKLTNVQ